MTRKIHAALALSALLFTGCSSTKLLESETVKKMEPVDLTGKTIAILALAGTEEVRATVENAIAKEFTERGAVGKAMHTLLPPAETKDKNLVKAALKTAGVDVLVCMRPLKKDHVTQQYVNHFNSTAYMPQMGYYDYGWYNPALAVQNFTYTIFTVEILVYGVASEELIWKGLTETFAVEKPEQVGLEIVNVAGKAMRKDGLLKPR